VKQVFVILTKFSFHEICESQWNTIVFLLEGSRNDSLQHRRFVSFANSNILSEFGPFPSILNDLKNTTFELLYRGSRDGCELKEFHRRCDGRCRTIVLIRTTKGNIFRGYTPLMWESTGGWKKDESLGTFLFTLKNPHGLDPIRFRFKSGQSTAIDCESSSLCFGLGADFRVRDNCNKNNDSYTNFGNSFENSTKIDSRIVLDGEHYFTVEELEVLAALQ
jgi:hypothetical protein